MAQLPKGWWLWRSVWWHLVVFSELPKLEEMKDLLLLSAAQICVRSSVTKGRCGPAWQDHCPSSYCQNIHLQSTFYRQDQKSRSGCGEPSFLSPTCFFTALLALVPSPRSSAPAAELTLLDPSTHTARTKALTRHAPGRVNGRTDLTSYSHC